MSEVPKSPIDAIRVKAGLPSIPNPEETRLFKPDELPSFPPAELQTEKKEDEKAGGPEPAEGVEEGEVVE